MLDLARQLERELAEAHNRIQKSCEDDRSEGGGCPLVRSANGRQISNAGPTTTVHPVSNAGSTTTNAAPQVPATGTHDALSSSTTTKPSPAAAASCPTIAFSEISDPTSWSPKQDFDSLAFASYTDAKKAEVLFNRLLRELEAARSTRRWNIEQDGDDVLICKNQHEKHEGCEYVRYTSSASENKERERWNLVRRWLTRQEPYLYIPGIYQAETVEAVNEAVDRALEERRAIDKDKAAL